MNPITFGLTVAPTKRLAGEPDPGTLEQTSKKKPRIIATEEALKLNKPDEKLGLWDSFKLLRKAQKEAKQARRAEKQGLPYAYEHGIKLRNDKLSFFMNPIRSFWTWMDLRRAVKGNVHAVTEADSLKLQQEFIKLNSTAGFKPLTKDDKRVIRTALSLDNLPKSLQEAFENENATLLDIYKELLTARKDAKDQATQEKINAVLKGSFFEPLRPRGILPLSAAQKMDLTFKLPEEAKKIFEAVLEDKNTTLQDVYLTLLKLRQTAATKGDYDQVNRINTKLLSPIFADLRTDEEKVFDRTQALINQGYSDQNYPETVQQITALLEKIVAAEGDDAKPQQLKLDKNEQKLLGIVLRLYGNRPASEVPLMLSLIKGEDEKAAKMRENAKHALFNFFALNVKTSAETATQFPEMEKKAPLVVNVLSKKLEILDNSTGELPSVLLLNAADKEAFLKRLSLTPLPEYFDNLKEAFTQAQNAETLRETTLKLKVASITDTVSVTTLTARETEYYLEMLGAQNHPSKNISQLAEKIRDLELPSELGAAIRNLKWALLTQTEGSSTLKPDVALTPKQIKSIASTFSIGVPVKDLEAIKQELLDAGGDVTKQAAAAKKLEGMKKADQAIKNLAASLLKEPAEALHPNEIDNLVAVLPESVLPADVKTTLQEYPDVDTQREQLQSIADQVRTLPASDLKEMSNSLQALLTTIRDGFPVQAAEPATPLAAPTGGTDADEFNEALTAARELIFSIADKTPNIQSWLTANTELKGPWAGDLEKVLNATEVDVEALSTAFEKIKDAIETRKLEIVPEGKESGIYAPKRKGPTVVLERAHPDWVQLVALRDALAKLVEVLGASAGTETTTAE